MQEYFTDMEKVRVADLGRFNVTQQPQDRFVFKVPGLRNVALTAPYLHDGSVDSLQEVVEIMMKHQLGVRAPEKDIALIVLFLKTLTGQYQGKGL
ncbi:cytochrome-c peroxidase [methane-oxidizing endosymbiont of Gigantopelta aegis]|uniref:cytochrome-c peroxidase n=1 Tax=methane-oxidizing endosymbiont of Gigantopelta aegis TaxID=2794938 RepID=UPI001FD931DE|nr:cytochrome-c peroxidase [methane-oxidizing endosymbiont of Gigantopelta aegis]